MALEAIDFSLTEAAAGKEHMAELDSTIHYRKENGKRKVRFLTSISDRDGKVLSLIELVTTEPYRLLAPVFMKYAHRSSIAVKGDEATKVGAMVELTDMRSCIVVQILQ